MTIEPIEYEAKSDREMLIIVASKTNEICAHLATLNGSVQSCQKDIAKLQTDAFVIAQLRKTAKKIDWQMATWIATVIGLILVTIGDKCGWW